MIGLLALALAATEPAPDVPPPGCEERAPIRDPAVCAPLYDDGTFVIQNMESVAVGSTAEMEHVWAMTRHCGLDNRIDGVGKVDIAVYDIFNATEQSRACVIDWIRENALDLVFTQERFDQRFEAAPLIGKTSQP
ncbi:hypothetical protein [Erythrobacter donghaensis]|uniref:hypothetical protein n=1 Tax=Erythrobacter donghaensis TaxID=267135 RepID=UPI00117CA973|nr:hypothetical protein [Erythrobacter donghaensis]